MILTNDIELVTIGHETISDTPNIECASAGGVSFSMNQDGNWNRECTRLAKEWLLNNIDEAPFDKICFK